MAATVITPSLAPAQSMRQLTLSDLVSKSDQIFVGQCIKKEALVRNGTIITRYTMRPSDMLKGKLDSTNNGNLIVEEMGGELPNGKVPIGVGVTGQAGLSQGEDVLLFTAKHKVDPKMAKIIEARKVSLAKAGKSTAPTLADDALRFVGMSQGYYTIITHPETGRKLVTHGGKIAALTAKQFSGNAITTGTAAITRKTLVRQINKASAEAQVAKAAKTSSTSSEQIQSYASLDDVKQQISAVLQKSK
jgi:hypothetical protein